MRTVAAIPAVALIAGAAFGVSLPSFDARLTFVAASCAVLLLAGACALRSSKWFPLIVAATFFDGGVVLGAVAWRAAWRPPLRAAFDGLARDERRRAIREGRHPPLDDEAFATVEGTLRFDASPTESGASLSLDVDAIALGARGFSRAKGGLSATVTGTVSADRIDEWRAGRRVRLPVTLHRPSRYLDPGVPDHERALARRGTTLMGTVKSGALVEVRARGSPVDEALSAVRAFSRAAIADAVGRWSGRSAAIVAAIVIGDRAGLDPDVQRRLQEAGTYHVIAISGGNIAILAGLLIGAFKFAGWLGRTALLSAIGLLIAYGMLVGGGASVDRATLMAVVYLAARAFDQRSPPLNALFVVAALLVAADPLTVTDPAFVLTFAATFAILVVMPAVASWRLPRWCAPAASMFAASAATEAFLFPVGAYVFSRVTFAGLGLNFLAIPLMAVAQVAGMAVVPLALVSRTLAAGAGWIAHFGAAGLVWSADLVRFVPALSYRIAPPPVFAMVLYYVAGGIACRRGPFGPGARFGPGTRRLAACTTIGAALWILVDPRTFVSRHGDGLLHVTFLDVGQGDSIFIRFPHGRTMLVDAGGLGTSTSVRGGGGGSFDVGDRVVAPVIRDAAFYRIDCLALSHGDPDHIGGAGAIVQEFRPREIWEGIPVPRSEPLTRLRMAAQGTASPGALWANVYAGDHVAIDGVDGTALAPDHEDWERQKVRNDDSIVLELRWRGVSVLLTGDIGKDVERRLLRRLQPSRLRVVKIPHHGSATSSTEDFVRALRPAVAVVSVGRANHFGHPVEEVMRRYADAGAEVFRTDRDGAVTVDTDGETLKVSTFVATHSSEAVSMAAVVSPSAIPSPSPRVSSPAASSLTRRSPPPSRQILP
ncbi:MAG TPA: ComEC/Rec2 family competence protein [Vicinamibacterales bacterium]|nr:ComEC/Rec2 family competence protein [Vicinamibacterales bacterium]